MVRFKNGRLNLAASVRAACLACGATNGDDATDLYHIAKAMEGAGFTVHFYYKYLDCLNHGVSLKGRADTELYLGEIKRVAQNTLKHWHGDYWLKGV